MIFPDDECQSNPSVPEEAAESSPAMDVQSVPSKGVTIDDLSSRIEYITKQQEKMTASLLSQMALLNSEEVGGEPAKLEEIHSRVMAMKAEFLMHQNDLILKQQQMIQEIQATSTGIPPMRDA